MSADRPVSPLIIRTYPDNYNPNTLSREPALQPTGGAGGGDASAANQVLGNASLSSIDGKLTNPLPVSLPAGATATTTAVNDTATTTTLLASNASRRGASIANDSSAALYVKCGATASLTSYAARVTQYGYYEVPFNYTGTIDGIWATDPNDGAARIVEFT